MTARLEGRLPFVFARLLETVQASSFFAKCAALLVLLESSVYSPEKLI